MRSGVFGSVNYDEMIGSLEGNEGYGRADYFLVGYDFPAYIECQDKVDEAYRNQEVRRVGNGRERRGEWNGYNACLSNDVVCTFLSRAKCMPSITDQR